MNVLLSAAISHYHESNPATGVLTLLQVNATGVMPVIFSSSLLALPTALARYANSRPVEAFAAAFNPSGPFYLPVSLYSLLHVLVSSPCLSCCPCYITLSESELHGMCGAHTLDCCLYTYTYINCPSVLKVTVYCHTYIAGCLCLSHGQPVSKRSAVMCICNHQLPNPLPNFVLLLFADQHCSYCGIQLLLHILAIGPQRVVRSAEETGSLHSSCQTRKSHSSVHLWHTRTNVSPRFSIFGCTLCSSITG